LDSKQDRQPLERRPAPRSNSGIGPQSVILEYHILDISGLCQTFGRPRSRKFVDWAHEHPTRDKQIEVISALTEGLGIRAVARITGVNRETVGKLAYQVGRGCAEIHDRFLVGIRVNRIECDELWAYVGHKRNPQSGKPSLNPEKGDQYTFIALGASSRAIIAYRTGKRDSEMTDQFIQDLRGRVIGTPEITTDGWHPYKSSIRDAFGKDVAHGIINKTYSVTHLNVTEASRRYSPAAVVAVAREVVSGEPEQISTSYVERQNLTIRMASKRFARLSNGFSKRLECHLAAVALQCRFL
jgi:IS1 family transposase